MSVAINNPILYPQTWDYFLVAQVPSPGIIARDGISGFERVYTYDKKNGKGALGTVPTITQRPAAHGRITLWLWSKTQIDFLEQTFIPLLQYDPTKTQATAFEIYHPSLTSVGINAVVTEDISPLKHVGRGKFAITFALMEFAPPPKLSAVSTPTETETNSDSAGETEQSKRIADKQRDLALLTKEARRLSNRRIGPL